MAKHRNKISGQYSVRLIEMQRSPAYRVLTRAAHQVMARLEIESAQHGGAENGNLPVTFDQFVEYGLHRRAVAPAIRELVALGFVEITQKGCAGNEQYRRPNLFRLTYRHAKGAEGDGTHEWRAIKTLDEAERLAQRARRNADPRAIRTARTRARKKFPSRGLGQHSVSVSGPEEGKVQ